MASRLLVALLLLCSFASQALSRVLSYAPYSNRISFPSIHRRDGRYFALVEALPGRLPRQSGQVVLYDTLGSAEPRVIYPTNPSRDLPIFLVALHEGDAGLTILVGAFTDSSLASAAYVISNDHGATWKPIPELDGKPSGSYQSDIDFGGPYSRGLQPQVSIGGPLPFVIGTRMGQVYGITLDGKARLLYSRKNIDPTLIGRNFSGTRFLVRTDDGGRLGMIDTQSPLPVGLGDLFGNSGWITSGGCAYAQRTKSLELVCGAQRSVLASDDFAFAVPTSDYDGAWIIKHRAGTWTKLLRHTVATGTEELWSDPTAPEVEALHTGDDRDRLLIQVHRSRGQAERSFADPALAVWRVGEPAPQAYDELFFMEQPTKGFVHVDVDTIGSGSPFVFDSGVRTAIGLAGNDDGSDVTQEWGVIRASLRQRLVLPGVARQRGAFHTQWQTDVVIQNPLDAPQKVALRFVTIGDGSARREPGPPIGSVAEKSVSVPAQLTLAAREIRVVNDVVKSLFGIDAAGGTLYIDPDSNVSATARTYTRAGEGTFGFGMPAIDFYNAVSSRFPATFAAAFPGANFRTNLLLTDTSGRGTEARLIARSGFGGSSEVTIDTPANGVLQMTELSANLGVPLANSGGLEIQPSSGFAIPALVAIDNRTNDPTYFPPDVISPDIRTIPMVAHIDAANGARLRSDLFLMNSSSQQTIVQFEVKRWDTNEPARLLSYALGAGQTQVIRDALMTMLDMTGVARVRYISGTATEPGVRVTSRTYSVNDDGGTYGCLIPPLNSFQSAAEDNSLEILGVTGGSGLRTDLALVDLSTSYNGRTATATIRIFDQKGAEIDSFDTGIPTAGGTEIRDIFQTRGLTPPEAALIRVDVTSGLIAAFATLTDPVTNDTTYLAANLAAKAK